MDAALDPGPPGGRGAGRALSRARRAYVGGMAEQQVAWTDTPYRAPVLDRNHTRIGTTESLLGDENEDIFHGIAISVPQHRKFVVVPAERVTRITLEHVETDLDEAGVAALAPYQAEQWFHLGWGGLFRKRPEWRPGE